MRATLVAGPGSAERGRERGERQHVVRSVEPHRGDERRRDTPLCEAGESGGVLGRGARVVRGRERRRGDTSALALDA